MAPMTSRAARTLLALLVVCAPGRVSQGWGPAAAHAWAPREVLSTDDLAANAYPAVTHVPCVLLLNATGSIGCDTPAGGVTAPLRRFEDLADVRRRLASRTILLLPASAFPEVLADHAKGAGWKTHAAGFMLEPGVDADGNQPAVSPPPPPHDVSSRDGTPPSTSGATLAKLLSKVNLGGARSFSPQPRRGDDDASDASVASGRVWNPGGFGAARARFENTPIALLDAAGADVARTFAAANGERGTSRVAEMRFPMAAAAAAAAANPAKRCLEQRTCQPVGGHSVLASVPPSPRRKDDGDGTATDTSRRGYLLVAARLDATAMFHDAAFGADAAMSGLVALMAVAKTYADAIRRARASLSLTNSAGHTVDDGVTSSDDTNEEDALEAFDAFLAKDAAPVVFAAFGAEAWGRAGSRRFAALARAAAESDAADVDALPRWMRRGFELGGVLEFGAVGFAARRDAAREGGEEKNASVSVFAHANAAALETKTSRRDGFPLVSALETAFAPSSAAANSADSEDASRDGSRVAFARASANDGEETNGDLPPSSARSFSFARLRRANANDEKDGDGGGDGDAPAVVLAEYDGAYVDGTFGSAFDVGLAAVDPARIARVCSATAEALTRLAFGEDEADDDADETETRRKRDSQKAASYGALVRAHLPDARSVERTTRALTECLIDPEVGFACALARSSFAPSEIFPTRYAGVAPPEAGKRSFDGEAEGRVGAGADDLARFAWEFLADATAASGGGVRREHAASCVTPDACADGEACVRVAGYGDVPGDVPGDADGAEDDVGSAIGDRAAFGRNPRRALLGSDAFARGAGAGTGTCVETSARFLPALSRRVAYDDDENRWTALDEAEDEDDPDPVWCESDWPSSIGARVFREASATVEYGAFIAGTAVTALAVLLTNRLDAVARARFKEE